MQTFTKDPNEHLDFDFDFSRWLPDGDLIASAVAEIAGSTATITTVEPSNTSVRVWLSGGVAAESGTITVRATTNEGRIKEAAVRIKIKETV